MKAIIALMLLLTLGKSLTCGGNCPSDTCSQCVCGNKTNVINISDYCDLMVYKTTASVNCCKCIATTISNGNSNFMGQSDRVFYYGVLAIKEKLIDSCPGSIKDPKQFCYWITNANCANYVYKAYNSWEAWGYVAKSCGCLNNSSGTKQI